MSEKNRKHMVDEVLASLKIEGLTVSDYCRSQLDEYIAGRMTRKMMLQMMDEYYIEEVVKERQGGKTIKTDIEDL
jgi:hypothetical protein